MEDKFFSLEEVSRYLKISKSTLYKLSQRNKIPSLKIGKQLRFRKSSVDQWLVDKESEGSVSLNRKSLMIKTHAPALGLSSKKVLLIDDDEIVLKSMVKLLKNHGYRVETAQSAGEALKKAAQLKPDLIITDIRMPGADGIEIIKRIRHFNHENKRPRVPEVIITGYIDPRAEKEAEKLGVTDYIHKPFSITEFLNTVRDKIASVGDTN
jgi:excisionase family DNA binding protein